MLDRDDHHLQRADSVITADVAANTAEGQVSKPDSEITDFANTGCLFSPEWSSL